MDDTPKTSAIPDTTPIADQKIDPSTPLFKVRAFALLFTTRVASTTATQMLAVVVGWHVYELTDSALQLGHDRPGAGAAAGLSAAGSRARSPITTTAA